MDDDSAMVETARQTAREAGVEVPGAVRVTTVLVRPKGENEVTEHELSHAEFDAFMTDYHATEEVVVAVDPVR